MKKIIFSSLLLLALAVVINAQPAAGDFFVGGNVGLYGSTDKTKSGGTTHKDQTTFHITVLPVAGFFVSDKLAVGGRLGVSSYVYKYPDQTHNKTTSMSFHIQPFARYYLISGQGGIFVEGLVGFSAGTRKEFYTGSGNIETRTVNIEAGFRPGIYYYITPKVALEGMFGWAGFSNDIEDNDGNKSIESDYGLDLDASTVYFGFTYTF
jgi:outer membrane protein